ncbi:MAG: sulfurtransferase [Gammaproteobacteria bacterium]|nr:sulfurtransferase [Gammaproteobacteria bacterium]
MTDTRKGQLTSCEELHDSLGRVAVVDCRFDLGEPSAGRSGYLEAHIPGAVFLDLDEDLAGPVTAGSGRHPLPQPRKIAAKLGQLGVRHDNPVVVYDAGNGAMAARAWWILRWLGHKQVRLLDGGLEQWMRLQLPFERGKHQPESCGYEFHVRDELVLTTQDVLACGESVAELNLLDARDAARYRGEIEPIDSVAGHVPGSRNVPFSDSMAKSGLWKPDYELNAMWRRHTGESLEEPLVMMCGSGVTACHLALSALQGGCREPRLYVGSWSEWIRDPQRPIAVGEV